MSEREWLRERRPMGDPYLDAHHFYSRLQFHAGGATEYLQESRKRPKRHNRGIERVALTHTVGLEVDCERALSPRYGEFLLPPSTAADVRYELQAGIHIVHDILPFSPIERQALRREVELQRLSRFDEDPPTAEPALVERWHRWLWMDELGEPQTNVEALGASAVLGEACARLNLAAREILGLPTGR